MGVWDWLPMALTFEALGVPHRAERFFFSGNMHFAFSFSFYLAKAMWSFILLRAVSCSRAGLGLGVRTLTPWLLPPGRQNEIKLILQDDLSKEEGRVKKERQWFWLGAPSVSTQHILPPLTFAPTHTPQIPLLPGQGGISG